MARIVGAALNSAGKFLGFVDSKGKIRKGRVRRVRNPQRTYKTESAFRKALAKATKAGTLVHWYGTDHGWVIVTR